MKKISYRHLILLLIYMQLLPGSLFAQSDSLQNSINSETSSFVDTPGKSTVFDSLSFKADSLTKGTQNILDPIDTLQAADEKVGQTIEKVNNWQLNKVSALDSLSSLPGSSGDNVFPEPARLSKKVDSLNSFSQGGLLNSIDTSQAIEGKADSTIQKVSNWQQNGINSLDSLSFLPNSSIGEENKSAFSEIQKDIKPKEIMTPVESKIFPEGIPYEAEEIDPVEVDGIEGLSGEIDKIEKYDALEKEVQDLSGQKNALQKLNKVNDYKSQSQLDSLSTEKVVDKVEEKAEGMAEEQLGNSLEGIEGETAFFDPSKANDLGSKAKYFQKKENVYQEINERAKALGLDGTKGFEDKLTAYQEKLSKYKKKYSDVENIKDLDKRPVNPMKGKPLRERLIWGGNFQVHRKNPFGIDLSPQVSYKLTRLLSVGIGGTYRIVINAERTGVRKGEQVYGGRSFIDYEVFKGFAAHIEYEQIRMLLPSPITDKDPQREWIISGLVGIKKRYSITKKIIGNAQILYNLLPDNKLLAPERIIFRFGFELAPSKKDTTSDNSPSEK